MNSVKKSKRISMTDFGKRYLIPASENEILYSAAFKADTMDKGRHVISHDGFSLRSGYLEGSKEVPASYCEVPLSTSFRQVRTICPEMMRIPYRRAAIVSRNFEAGQDKKCVENHGRIAAED